MSDLLASYSETRSEGRRRFELQEDRVFVKGSISNADFETTVMLADLRPKPDRLWLRPGAFLLGVVMLILASPAYSILRRAASDEMAIGGASGLVITGLVICLKTMRKVEFARFQSHTGLALLDVARAGPDRHRFDEFVAQLVQQIEQAQESKLRPKKQDE